MRILALASLALLFVSNAHAGIMFNVNAQWGSEALVTKVLVQQQGNDLKFTLTVDDSVSPFNTGDLRGIYFDVNDESLLGGLIATGADVTGQVYDANNVYLVSGGTTIKPKGPFDAGIEIGTAGTTPDDIQTTMFVLAHNTMSLDLNSFFRVASGASDDYIMAIRGTSVGQVGSSRSGSSKSGATGGTFGPPVIPEPGSLTIWLTALGLCAFRRGRRS